MVVERLLMCKPGKLPYAGAERTGREQGREQGERRGKEGRQNKKIRRGQEGEWSKA